MHACGVQRYFGETDIEALKANSVAATPPVRRFSQSVSPRQYNRYRKALVKATGLDLKHLDVLPPMLILSSVSAALINTSGRSMDELLWNEAKAHSIPCAGLETFEEQLQIFGQIPFEYQASQLKKLLSNLRKGRQSILDLIDLYERQAVHQLYRAGKKTLGPIRHLMLAQRNKIMVDRVFEHTRESNENALFAVGAAHLAGKHGLIHGLKQLGLKVRPRSGLI